MAKHEKPITTQSSRPLNKEEFSSLIFHFGISKRGGTRKLPRVFTEHGILMLSSVLNSKRAIQVNTASGQA
jgi:hypothetical protein